MKDRHKLLGFWILFLLTLVSIFFMNVPLSPKYGEEIRATTVVFKILGPSPTLLIDDNPSFSSPLVAQENEEIVLPPGNYYWKANGISLVSTFTLVSAVALDITQEQKNEARVMNTGNVRTEIRVHAKKQPLTGSFILEPQDDLAIPLDPLDEETTILGEQYERP